MKKLKKLTRQQKIFLAKQGLDPLDFLLERTLVDGYVFYNRHSKVLWTYRDLEGWS